jgi:hypothetical protein
VQNIDKLRKNKLRKNHHVKQLGQSDQNWIRRNVLHTVLPISVERIRVIIVGLHWQAWVVFQARCGVWDQSEPSRVCTFVELLVLSYLPSYSTFLVSKENPDKVMVCASLACGPLPEESERRDICAAGKMWPIALIRSYVAKPEMVFFTFDKSRDPELQNAFEEQWESKFFFESWWTCNLTFEKMAFKCFGTYTRGILCLYLFSIVHTLLSFSPHPNLDHFTLVTNCAVGNNLIMLFLLTFTDTGHFQRVLSVRKFINYSVLLHTQTRLLSNRSKWPDWIYKCTWNGYLHTGVVFC